MLLSLRASLHADIVSGVTQCQADVPAMGDRIYHIEATMGEYSTSFNKPVDAHSGHKEAIAWIKDKIANLEDQSRRNKIKIGGMPEAVAYTPCSLLLFRHCHL